MNTRQQHAGSEIKPGVMVQLAVMQALSSLGVALLFFVGIDTRAAVSAALGGAVAVLMSLFMASRMLTAGRIARRRLVAPGEALMRFYLSVIFKVLFTLVMMAMCLIFIKVSVLPFIITYLVAAVLVNWLALLTLDH